MKKAVDLSIYEWHSRSMVAAAATNGDIGMSATNKTYAIIENNSDLVWGVTTAGNEIDAVRAIDQEVDPSAAASCSYVEHGARSGEATSGIDGYWVYLVPAEKAAAAGEWTADDYDALTTACGEPVSFIETRRHVED